MEGVGGRGGGPDEEIELRRVGMVGGCVVLYLECEASARRWRLLGKGRKGMVDRYPLFGSGSHVTSWTAHFPSHMSQSRCAIRLAKNPHHHFTGSTHASTTELKIRV